MAKIAKTINFPEKPGICVIEILSMNMYFFNFNHFNLNPYHAELYTQDITCMLNCFEEISQNLAFFLFLLCS